MFRRMTKARHRMEAIRMRGALSCLYLPLRARASRSLAHRQVLHLPPLGREWLLNKQRQARVATQPL